MYEYRVEYILKYEWTQVLLFILQSERSNSIVFRKLSAATQR